MSILFQLPELSEYFFFIKRLLIYYCNKKISLKTKNKIFDESRRQEISLLFLFILSLGKVNFIVGE